MGGVINFIEFNEKRQAEKEAEKEFDKQKERMRGIAETVKGGKIDNDRLAGLLYLAASFQKSVEDYADGNPLHLGNTEYIDETSMILHEYFGVMTDDMFKLITGYILGYFFALDRTNNVIIPNLNE